MRGVASGRLAFVDIVSDWLGSGRGGDAGVIVGLYKCDLKRWLCKGVAGGKQSVLDQRSADVGESKEKERRGEERRRGELRLGRREGHSI